MYQFWTGKWHAFYLATYIFFYFSLHKGEALAPKVIISSHVVHNQIQCSIKCLEQKHCVGFNYLVAVVKELEINCQISNSTQHNNRLVSKGAWSFYTTCQGVHFLRITIVLVRLIDISNSFQIVRYI